MNQEEFNALEVKPRHSGFYFVTLYQFNKIEDTNQDYINDWLEYDGNNWDYGGYKDNCYVCFISKKDD